MKLDKSYKNFIVELKQKIYSSKIKAILSANRLMIELFYNSYKDNSNLQQLVGEIPWGSNIVIFTKCKDDEQREYYINSTIEFGWNKHIA